jgi:hypothetical protein
MFMNLAMNIITNAKIRKVHDYEATTPSYELFLTCQDDIPSNTNNNPSATNEIALKVILNYTMIILRSLYSSWTHIICIKVRKQNTTE